jgi:hypothetical protein
MKTTKIIIIVALIIGFCIGGAIAMTTQSAPSQAVFSEQPQRVSENCYGAYERGALWYCCNGQCSINWLTRQIRYNKNINRE